MSLSKYFDVAMKGQRCTDIFHPGGSCWQATVNNFTKPLPTCAKFFTPIFCVQLLRKVVTGNYDKHTLSELVYAFIGTTITGYLGSACGQTCCCIAYHLLGKFYLHTCVMVPVCLGNFWGFYMPEKVNSYFADYLSMMIIEAFYRCEETFYWRLIKNSNLVRTVLFMTMSAFILSTNQTINRDVVWFIQSVRQNTGDDDDDEDRSVIDSPMFDRLVPAAMHVQVCRHRDSCDSHVFRGVKSSLKLGLAIEVVRFLLENLTVIQKSPTIVLGIFSRIKLRVVSFFVAYTAAYRILNCALNRYNGRHTPRANTFSAFFSAAVFYVCPDLTMLSHATVSTVKLLWLRYVCVPAKKSDQSTTMRSRLAALPMSRLVYMFAIGYVFHLRLLYPWTCSSILFKTTFFTSGFISDGVTLNAAKYLLGNQ